MCHPTTCRVCGRTTWSGCGQHVQAVRRSVAASQWCGRTHTPAEIAAAKAARPGLIARLLRR